MLAVLHASRINGRGFLHSLTLPFLFCLCSAPSLRFFACLLHSSLDLIINIQLRHLKRAIDIIHRPRLTIHLLYGVEKEEEVYRFSLPPLVPLGFLWQIIIE